MPRRYEALASVALAASGTILVALVSSELLRVAGIFRHYESNILAACYFAPLFMLWAAILAPCLTRGGSFRLVWRMIIGAALIVPCTLGLIHNLSRWGFTRFVAVAIAALAAAVLFACGIRYCDGVVAIFSGAVMFLILLIDNAELITVMWLGLAFALSLAHFVAEREASRIIAAQEE